MKYQRRRRKCPIRRISLAVLFVFVVLDFVGRNACAGVAVADDDEKPSSRLVESLWQTLRQTLEKTSQALSSSKAALAGDQTTPRGTRPVLSSKRIALKRKTLYNHFQNLVTSGDRRTFSRDQKQRAVDVSNMRQEHRNALRWKDVKTNCFCFSESVKAYWSFQWCPLGVIIQGLRGSDDTFDAKTIIGAYVPFQSLGMPSLVDEAQLFARSVRNKHPEATIEVYHNGSLCGNGIRRMAVVVHHDETSDFCAGDWTRSITDLAIESVDEPYECKYIVNVCAPRTLEEDFQDDDVASFSEESTEAHTDSNILNQTIFRAQQSLKSYMLDSTADYQRKLSPDRTTSLHAAFPPLPFSRIQSNLQLVKDMFSHAYDSYMIHAFPASDIKPMTCQPATFDLVKIPGLTLIDALDTLMVMGNYTEFARAVERLRGLHKQARRQNAASIFALDQNVSVFETNIRVLGGLLSAHQLAEAFVEDKVLEQDVWAPDREVLLGPLPSEHISTFDGACIAEESKTQSTCKKAAVQYWHYDGFLLKLAEDLGDRLLPAFTTRTGIPFGTVNLIDGVPQGETPIASLAGGGTLTLEMELLSRLTGNPVYGKASKLAARALWMRRSDLDLLGKHICSDSGVWTETLSGIGSNSDSFYEYLAKHYFLFPEDSDFWPLLTTAYSGVFTQARLGEWYGDVDFNKGGSVSVRRVFEALMAFYPGMQVMLGEIAPAAGSLNSFFLVREHLGFLPERFNYLNWKVDTGGGHHFLRPELLESAYFMHHGVKGFQQQSRKGSNIAWSDSSGWQWAGDFALHTMEEMTRTTCGYASIKSVSPMSSGLIENTDLNPNLLNEMPSFFLSETLKYLYLLFDDRNVIHTDPERDWIMTTEAHPIHHVDLPRRDVESTDMRSLKEKLVQTLQSRLRVKSKNDGDFPQASFHSEKWADKTTHDTYVEHLLAIPRDYLLIGSTKLSYGPDFWAESDLVQSALPRFMILPAFDAFNEIRSKRNAAHITLGRFGLGNTLTKACPNFHLPSLLWIHALNGGMTDYSEAYVSSATDNPAVDEVNFHIAGAMESLGLLGAGLHIANILLELRETPKTEKPAKSDSSSNSLNKISGDTLNLGGDLGDFEVSSFAEGSGFAIRRHNSGELVVTTLINDDTGGAEKLKTYVMVHSYLSITDGDAKFTDSYPSAKQMGMNDKTSVIADTRGNAFFCVIELVLRSETNEVDENEAEKVCRADDHVESLVARYPCAPAMFGPSHIEELADTDGLVVESSWIKQPDDDNRNGCCGESLSQMHSFGAEADDTISKEGTPSGSINFVHRGQCTFEEKSFCQKEHNGAAAVVVINTSEDELFTMSGGGIFADELDSSDFPPTVLLTGEDGKDMLRRAAILAGQNIFARVSIVRDKSSVSMKDNKVNIQNSEKSWPVVRSSSDAVQIFAESGWGVHAVQRRNEDHADLVEWQLFLMRHNSERT